jgi:pimeloyl-ACP methyl ester carboxylesterase
MTAKVMNIRSKSWPLCKPATVHFAFLLACSLVLLTVFGQKQALAQWPHVAVSKDGVPIAYEVMGSGETTLVFVHGWSCDSRYWRMQTPYFSENYRIIVLDLAGHGNSGMARTEYTMASFGEDVKAVVEAVDAKEVILIGHSMGGSVIAEAARLMPDRVIGLIGVDTLENIEYPLTQEHFESMIAPLEADFKTGAQGFISSMMSSDTDKDLREWILADMSAAPPAVAMSALRELMAQYITGDAAKVFDELRIPVITVNADKPTKDYEPNRRHMFSYDAIVLKNADHFLMMNRSEEFNTALSQAVQMLMDKQVK